MASTKSTSNTKQTSDAKKIKELENTIAELNNMVKLLMQQGVNPQYNNADRDVVFISLCNHILNLSTEPNGGGDVYTFYEFGEEQPIPYSDARKIIRNNKNFIKGGKCYIADDEIITTEHLSSEYKKILDKDTILELLSFDKNKFFNIFDAMTDMQKEIFRDILVDRLSKDKNSVDMNIVQYVNEFFNTDILANINYGKELLTSEE